MIITRTPLRISLGGGGTDLPSYYQREGGFVLSAAIDKYVYIGLHKTFVNNYIIKYSRMEVVERIDQIQHPIVREAFQSHRIRPMIEMVSLADLPAGTGLGSSGSFSVGLLRSIYSIRREVVSAQDLAEEACRIEIERLKEPSGKQDQYIAALGGLQSLTIAPDGKVEARSLRISQDALHHLQDHLLLFFTGYSRKAGDVLADQKTRTESNDPAMLANLDRIKEIGKETQKCLESGAPKDLGQLFNEHWAVKRARSGSISDARIDGWYELGIQNGALGGKLLGAGGGGFLLFYAPEHDRLRTAMAKAGLPEVRFDFDFEGSKVIVQHEP